MKKKTKASGKRRGGLHFVLFGIFIGFIIGGSVVWWYNNKNAGWLFSKDLFEIFRFNSGNDKNILITNNSGEDKLSTKKSSGKEDLAADELISMSIEDSISLLFDDPSFSEYYEQLKSGEDSLVPDSIILRKFLAQAISPEKSTPLIDDIIVKKDMMVFTKTINIENPEEAANVKENNLDSLLTDKITVVNAHTNKIIVEFWSSPVNFKGYKMSKHKIVIFGIEPSENIKVRKSGKSHILSINNKAYLLEYTDEFKSLNITK